MDQKILKELQEIKKSLANTVTKDDLGNFATKDDLRAMETHFETELNAMEKRLTKKIDDVEISVTVNADSTKADKSDLDSLERRVTKIEQKLTH